MLAFRQPRASAGWLVLVAGLGAYAAAAEDQKAEPAAPAASAEAPETAAPAAPAADAAAADPALAAAIEAGHTEYLKNCRPCHGSKGTAGVPLAGNEKVSGGADYLVWAIITGPGYMPEFGPVLSDEQIAAIATFIENSWGNANGIVLPEDVQAAR